MNTSEQNQLQDVDRISVRAGRRIRETAGQLGETAARASEGLGLHFSFCFDCS